MNDSHRHSQFEPGGERQRAASELPRAGRSVNPPPRVLPQVTSRRPKVLPPKAPHGISPGWNRFWIGVAVLLVVITTVYAAAKESWSVSGVFVWFLVTAFWVVLALYNAGQIQRKKTLNEVGQQGVPEPKALKVEKTLPYRISPYDPNVTHVDSSCTPGGQASPTRANKPLTGPASGHGAANLRFAPPQQQSTETGKAED